LNPHFRVGQAGTGLKILQGIQAMTIRPPARPEKQVQTGKAMPILTTQWEKIR
jgi:hypothetical protein